MPRAKARPERPRVRSGSACGVFRLSVRRGVCRGMTARPCLFGNGPAADWAGSSGWVRRLGSSVGFVVGAVVGPAGRPSGGSCPVVSVLGRPGRHTARNGRRFGRPLLEKGLAVGSVFGARFRVWRSVPCLALGPVFGACRERPALRGAFVPVPASGCPGGAIAPPRSSRR